MAIPRKLQAEIDRLLKKVAENMEVYETTYEKVEQAPNQVQKDKFEAELKKEIKKLQRLREQIKILHQNPEVKDKSQLEQTRRAIELKMEGFKVVEKQHKMKAFGWEGLAASKDDPVSKAKTKTCTWVSGFIKELQEQNEQIEFDLAENEGTKKTKKKGSSTSNDKEERIDRARYHINKLESILRCIVNGDIEPTEIDDIKDDVQSFVEGFNVEGYEEDYPDVYDVFDLPDVDQLDAVGGTNREDESSDDDDDAESPKRSSEKPMVPIVKTPAKAPAAKEPPKVVIPQPNVKPQPKVIAKPDAKAPSMAAGTPSTPNLVTKQPTAPVIPPGKTMADMLKTKAADAKRSDEKKESKSFDDSTASKHLDQGPSEDYGLLGNPDDLDDDGDMDAFGDEAMNAVDRNAGLDSLAAITKEKEWNTDKPPAAGGRISAPEPAAAPPQLAPAPPSDVGAPPAGPSAASTTAALPPMSTMSNISSSTSSTDRQRLLDVSLKNLLNIGDCERQKAYSPPNPYATPAYYPQTVHTAFSNPESFSRFDIDTLFFIFYYQQTTYQQYLSAKELKKQSWRYHKRFQTWFQRHDRPKQANDEQEQGTYIYFDYESGWCQRIKSDFVFRYAYLEDELQ